MELILWRHADAEDGQGKADADRELTRRGRKQAERMAEWLRAQLNDDWRILVSPAKRALQTVEPLDRPFEESGEVGLAATPASILRAADWPDGKRPVVVVGHQPTLGQVVAHLMGGPAGDVAIRKGAIWWFVTRKRDGAETVLQCVIDPERL